MGTCKTENAEPQREFTAVLNPLFPQTPNVKSDPFG